MTYEDLIVAIDDVAPHLSGAGYKVLWRLVSLSIQQGSNEVTISCSELGRQLGMTRDAITMAHRQLVHLISIDVSQGSKAVFTLPAEWFGLQRPLFVTETNRPTLINMTRNQAGTCLEIRQVPDDKPGKSCLETRQDLTTNQARPAWKVGSTWGKTRQDLTTNQASSPPDTYRNAPARVDRSIDSDSAALGKASLIDSILRTVEIRSDQREDAQILSELIQEYRGRMGVASTYDCEPDEAVIARILAIAPMEQLCGVLRKLLDNRVRPGKQDWWFGVVLLQKIHGCSAKLVAERYDRMKTRKPPMTETLPGFGTSLTREISAAVSRF